MRHILKGLVAVSHSLPDSFALQNCRVYVKRSDILLRGAHFICYNFPPAPSNISACSLTFRTQRTTGQNTSAPLGRSTTITAELRSPSGRSPRTCWRGESHLMKLQHFNSDSHRFSARCLMAHRISLSLVQNAPAHCDQCFLLYVLQGTKTERLNQDRSEQFPPGHGLQTRGLAGQSHDK